MEEDSSLLEIPELGSGNPQLQKAMNKIVKVEQKGLDKFDEKVQKEDNKLQLVRDLKTKFTDVRESLTPFKSVGDFRELRGESSDESVLKVTSIDKKIAIPGTYDIEVIGTANTSSIMTYGFADRDQSEVGIGYMTLKLPSGDEREVYINSDNNTLDGVAATINAGKMGVHATVVNDGTDSDEPWRLVISGEGTGWKNDMKWAEFHMLDGDLELDAYRSREAKSAIVKFNGQPMYLDENKMKNILPGVNIDIKDAKPGKPIKIEITPDIEKMQGKAKNFVDKLNGVLDFFGQQAQLGKDSHKDPKKALAGDTVLIALQSRMRTIIQESQGSMSSSDISRLRDVGIVFNRAGTLDFDADKFQKTLENRFEDVARLFSGDGAVGGFAQKMIGVVDGVVRRGDGMMTLRETNLQSKIRKLGDEKDAKTTKAEARIERIKGQFGRAEAAIQQMNQVKSGIGQGG